MLRCFLEITKLLSGALDTTLLGRRFPYKKEIIMPQLVSTQLLMPPDLHSQVQQTAQQLKKDFAWVVNQALWDFVQKTDRRTLAVEARRQSLLIREHDSIQDDWEENVDDSDWRL